MAIILTRKGEQILVDDSLFDELNQHTWWLDHSGYALTTQRIEGKKVDIRMHRLIMGLKPFRAGDIQVVDHINGRCADNRKENLRIVTKGQNSLNPNNKTFKNNKCGYKGVRLNKRNRTQKYIARIYINGKDIHLGSFPTPEEAHEAYLAAKSKYHTFD